MMIMGDVTGDLGRTVFSSIVLQVAIVGQFYPLEGVLTV